MSKHDLKAKKIQVKAFDNKEEGFIITDVPIKIRDRDVDLTDPLCLITKEYVDSKTSNMIPVLAVWESGELVVIDYFRTHVINGIESLFRSNINDNNNEPVLGDTLPAWTDLESNGDVFPQWDNSTSYPIGELVQFFNLNNVVYRSKSTEVNHNPESDLSQTYWDIVGYNPVLFESGEIYTLNQVVLDEADSYRRYVSNVSSNSYALNGEIANPWSLIGELFNHALLPSPWSVTPTPLDAIRWYAIDGVTYQFASTIEGNTSVPTLEAGGPAWTNIGGDGFPVFHDSFDTYNLGDLVRKTFSGNQNVFKSKINGNLTHNPTEGTTDAFWEYMGIMRSFFPDDAPYAIDDIVINGDTNELYVSNVSNNNYPLDGQITGSWILLGPKSYAPDEPLTFINPTLPLVSEGNYSLSFNLQEGKSIISIERLQGGVISRGVPIGNAFTTPANNPNTVIEGFDNNAPQTITIKIQ